MKSNSEKNFNDAFNKISSLKEGTITPDTMLKLYAYNKQANFGKQSSSNTESDVRNAFKFNAWVQLKGMSSKEAEKEYIKLANKVLNNKK